MSRNIDVFGVRAATAGLILVLGPLAQPARADPPKAPNGQAWAKLDPLTDEFDGSTVDLTKWQLRSYAGRIGSALFKFDPANVAVAAGNLEVAARPIPLDRKEVPADLYGTQWISTGVLSSNEPLAVPGTYVEARLRASQTSVVSAFWFQNTNGAKDQAFRAIESDVVEALGQPIENPATPQFSEGALGDLIRPVTHYFQRSWSCIAKDGPNAGRNACDDMQPFPATAIRVTKGQSGLGTADWHIYGTWWESPTVLHYYVDGQLVRTIETNWPEDLARAGMYLIFDQEVHASQTMKDGKKVPLGPLLPPLDLLNDPVKNAMQVDYVRAWQLTAAK